MIVTSIMIEPTDFNSIQRKLAEMIFEKNPLLSKQLNHPFLIEHNITLLYNTLNTVFNPLRMLLVYTQIQKHKNLFKNLNQITYEYQKLLIHQNDINNSLELTPLVFYHMVQELVRLIEPIKEIIDFPLSQREKEALQYLKVLDTDSTKVMIDFVKQYPKLYITLN